MAHLDAFLGDGFTEAELTDAINAQPFVPGRVGEMGLFDFKSIRTTKFEIERKDGSLSLIPVSARGTPSHQNTRDRREVRNFETARIALADTINADEIQNMRQFGDEAALETFQAEVTERQSRMAKSFDATIEHMLVNALKGQFVDHDGTVIMDAFAEWGLVAPAPIDLNLDVAAPALRRALGNVMRSIEDSVGNETISGYHVLCGSEFMDELVDNTEVKDARHRADEEQKTRRYARRTFDFGGVHFEEYRGTVPDGTGTARQFIGDDEGIVIPMGTGYFKGYYAPADYISAVNRPGLPRYSSMYVDPRDRFVEVDAQTNIMVMCTRPEIIRTLVRT